MSRHTDRQTYRQTDADTFIVELRKNQRQEGSTASMLIFKILRLLIFWESRFSATKIITVFEYLILRFIYTFNFTAGYWKSPNNVLQCKVSLESSFKVVTSNENKNKDIKKCLERSQMQDKIGYVNAPLNHS